MDPETEKKIKKLKEEAKRLVTQTLRQDKLFLRLLPPEILNNVIQDVNKIQLKGGDISGLQAKRYELLAELFDDYEDLLAFLDENRKKWQAELGAWEDMANSRNATPVPEAEAEQLAGDFDRTRSKVQATRRKFDSFQKGLKKKRAELEATIDKLTSETKDLDKEAAAKNEESINKAENALKKMKKAVASAEILDDDLGEILVQINAAKLKVTKTI